MNITVKTTPNASAQGLIGAWDPGNATGLTVPDLTGLGNIGVITNGTSNIVLQRKTLYGNVWQMLYDNGTATQGLAYIDCGTFTSLHGLSSATLSFWASLSPIARSTQAIVEIGKNAGVDNRFGVQRHHIGGGSPSAYGMSSNGGPGWGAALDPTKGIIEHYCLVFDGTQATDALRLKLYVNGVQQTLVFTGTIHATITALAGNFYIGNTVGSYSLSGHVGPVEVYNRAFAAAEVSNLFNRGKVAGYIHGNGVPISTAARGGYTGAYLETSDWRFGDTSGRFSITTTSLGGRPCKALTTTTSSSWFLYITNDSLSQSQTEAAYGTWEFTFKCTTYNQFQYYAFIYNGPGAWAASNYGYYLNPSSNGSLQMWRAGVGGLGAHVLMWNTGASFFVDGTAYQIKIVRTYANVFYTYIKGGTYTKWTLIPVTSGTNPITDTTYTTANCQQIMIHNGATPLFVFSDPRGEYSFKKYLLPVFPT